MITREQAVEMVKTDNQILIDLALTYFPNLGNSNFEKACDKLQRFSVIPEGLSKQMQALHQLETITEAENGDWEYTAGESYYYPIFNFDNDFSFNYVAGWSSRLAVPAPLVFKSERVCERVVRENFNLYKQAYLK